MYGLGHNSELVGSTIKWCRGGTEAGAGCSRSDAVRCGARGWQKLQHDGIARSEQVGLVRLGSAPLHGCITIGKVRDQQAWLLVSCVLVLTVLGREEHCSEVKRLLHVVQGCRPSATWAATTTTARRQGPHVGRRWRGKRPHCIEMPSVEKQGR